jgi:mRNA-degrading endonuclease RelE of RelBE toxin-antitoxin system
MSSPRYKWTLDKSDTFTKYIQKSKDEGNRSYFKKLGQVIDDLATSDYPNRMGKKKTLKYGVLLAIDITDDLRLTYTVDHATRIITLVRLRLMVKGIKPMSLNRTESKIVNLNNLV